MNNVAPSSPSSPRRARSRLVGSLLLAGICAGLVVAGSLGSACWPLAPVGGSLDAGAGSEGGTRREDGGEADGATVLDDATTGEADGGTSEGGSSSDGSATDAATPVQPHPSTAIAQGIGFACAIVPGGKVSCWGNNQFGQAGAPVTGASAAAFVAHPTTVANVTNAIAIALGDYHACAVTASNAVYCWGLDNASQLAHGEDAGIADSICPGAVAQQTVACNPTPTIASVPAAVAVSAAGSQTCTIGVDGTVTCWGAVQNGTTVSGSVTCGLGTARSGGTCYPAPYAPGVSGAGQLAVGFDHACTRSAGDGGGVATCWGNNGEGQVWPSCPFGCETQPEHPSLPAVTSIGAGRYFTCALVPDDGGPSVSCFGDNSFGQLGQVPPGPDASGAFNVTPTTVAGLGPVSELVVAGNEAACALLDGGTVSCWGNVAAATQTGVPVTITGLPPMTSLGVPDDSYACGVATDGGTWCWYLVDGGGPTFVQ